MKVLLSNSLVFWYHDCLDGLPGRISEYKREHTHYFKRRFHTCRVPGCNKTMDWDRSMITTHLKKNHPSLPLRRYYEDYIKKVNNTILIMMLDQLYLGKGCSSSSRTWATMT